MIRLVILLAFALAVWRVVRSLLPQPAPPRGAPPGWNPWTVLGVTRGAPAEAITHAYRERMKEYHPDRVAGLGAELQELAHQKTVEIQRAYDELRTR